MRNYAVVVDFGGVKGFKNITERFDGNYYAFSQIEEFARKDFRNHLGIKLVLALEKVINDWMIAYLDYSKTLRFLILFSINF